MTAPVTVTLSQELSEKVQKKALLRHQAVVDVVETLLTQALITDDDEATIDLTEPNEILEQEIMAYHRLHAMLWQTYPGQYVAIQGGKVIDHDQDRVALSRRVRTRLPDQFVLIRRVMRQPERTLYFRSPRFAENQR